MPGSPSSPPPLPPRPRAPVGPATILLDRVRAWRADPRVGVAALLVAALVAGLVWYRVGLDAPARGEQRAGVGAPRVPARQARTRVARVRGDTPVVVHVAGAVVRPGIVRLAAGARVVDALDAAGGGVPGADLDRLNLAARVTDGQRIAVARVGEPAGAPPGGGGDATAPAARLDLNTATEAQLEQLPGIGPSLAAAIVRERERRGGFKSVDELRRVRGIGDRRFADLKDLVTV